MADDKMSIGINYLPSAAGFLAIPNYSYLTFNQNCDIEYPNCLAPQGSAKDIYVSFAGTEKDITDYCNSTCKATVDKYVTCIYTSKGAQKNGGLLKSHYDGICLALPSDSSKNCIVQRKKMLQAKEMNETQIGNILHLPQKGPIVCKECTGNSMQKLIDSSDIWRSEISASDSKIFDSDIAVAKSNIVEQCNVSYEKLMSATTTTTVSASIASWIIPVVVVLVILAMSLSISVFYFQRRRRRRQPDSNDPELEAINNAKIQDTISSIAATMKKKYQTDGPGRITRQLLFPFEKQ
jgi:hypothetical protein